LNAEIEDCEMKTDMQTYLVELSKEAL